MRKTFLQPVLQQLRQGHWSWLLRQLGKTAVIKFINPLLGSRKEILPWRTGPVMAVLIPTYRCNSNCLACDLKKRGDSKKEIGTGKLKKIIDEMVELGSSGLSLTGGEPLLRKDIFDLIAYANQKGLVTTLNTNGLLLNKESIDKLLEAGPDNTNISLEAADEHLYQTLRGSASFEDLIVNIKQFSRAIKRVKKRMILTAVTVVSSQNYHQLLAIAKLAKKIGMNKIGFIPLHRIPTRSKRLGEISCGDDRLKKRSFEKMFKKIREIIPIDNSQEYWRMFSAAFAGKKFPLPCLATQTSLFIDCYSNVYYCWPQVEIDQPVGNLKEHLLKEIWQGEKFRKARQSLESCRACFWNCQAELSIFFKKF